MAPSKLRRAIGVVKDQTSIGLAKVNNTASLSDLEVAIVKATRHEEFPAEERHIREILCLTSYSGAMVGACVTTLSRRLSKTRDWCVALKTLMLIQRLLAEGDPAYEQEIFFSTRRGTRLLNMSDFRDASGKSEAWDYSAFVRTYALYLDERLEYRMQGRQGKLRGGHASRFRIGFGMNQEEEDDPESAAAVDKKTPVCKMKIEHLFSRIQHLQQILERLLACRPTGTARDNRLVIVALYPVVKESFLLYYEITEILGILVDRFMDLELANSARMYEIFCRVSKQFDELDRFYRWCKNVGIARTSEYPDVDKITQKKLDLMDDFIRDKSALAQTSSRDSSVEPKLSEPREELEEEPEADMNTIKALPPPEEPVEEQKVEAVREEKEEELKQEADLLNLGEDAMSLETQADQLALALFDGAVAPTQAHPALPWQAFAEENADWETALVQSVSSLPNQKTTFGDGFDTMLLNGMYQQGAAAAATAAVTATGSASSVAFGSAGRPAMLALPAPPTADGKSTGSADPFAASLAIAPPTYVQMSDMERKQRLLMDEQQMWQQYARDGMRGEVGLSKLQYPHNYYNRGGYLM